MRDSVIHIGDRPCSYIYSKYMIESDMRVCACVHVRVCVRDDR